MPGCKAFCLALLLGASLTPGLWAEAGPGPEGFSYWSSDQAGFRGEGLGGPKDAEWVLALGAGFQAGHGARILYHGGVEAERTVARAARGLREELLYREGILVSIQRLDPKGALVEEELYDAPSPDSTLPRLRSSTRWTYVEGRLSKAEAFDGSGAATGSLDYSYDASGRLLQVLAAGSLGSGAAGILVSPQGLGASWSDTELTRYDASGRPREILAYATGQVIASSLLAYSPSGVLASRTREDLVSGTRTTTEYDSAGHVILEVETRGARELSRRSLAWDGQGRLARDYLKAGDRITEVLWVYGEDGELSRSTQKIDGMLVTVVHELPGDKLVKEVYDGGVLALRATSLKGRLVQEDFYATGAPVRTKVYP